VGRTDSSQQQKKQKKTKTQVTLKGGEGELSQNKAGARGSEIRKGRIVQGGGQGR